MSIFSKFAGSTPQDENEPSNRFIQNPSEDDDLFEDEEYTGSHFDELNPETQSLVSYGLSSEIVDADGVKTVHAAFLEQAVPLGLNPSAVTNLAFSVGGQLVTGDAVLLPGRNYLGSGNHMVKG